MGSINDDGVGTGIHQSLHTVERIGSHTYAGSHTQTALVILTSHGLILGLGNVLIGNQTNQTIILVDHGQLLNLVLLQNLGSCNQVSLLVGSHEIILRHDLLNGTIQATLETKVAVGHDTHEVIIIVNYGDTTNMILRHNIEGLRHC